MAEALLGLGSNLGDPAATIERALARLGGLSRPGVVGRVEAQPRSGVGSPGGPQPPPSGASSQPPPIPGDEKPAHLRLLARSCLYRTPPWGPVPQPDFVNACALVETDLPPRALLASTQAIERELGRGPGERWGPRALDIDILDYDGLVLAGPGLTLPHPHLAGRAFVLVPLAEIAPDRVVAGRRVAEWLRDVDATGIERL